MRVYLIATHANLYYVEFADDWTVLSIETLHSGHHYGIALDGSAFVASASHENFGVWEMNAPAGRWPFGLEIDIPTGEIHQLACTEQGYYFANTQYNSLVFISKSVTEQYFIDGLQTDENHINSVFPCGSEIWTMLHNRKNARSEILVLEHNVGKGFRPIKRLPLWHRGCHNVYVNQRYLFYNASLKGRFVAVDWKKNRIHQEIQFNGHTKGLSVTEDAVVIGVSEHAERERRSLSNAQLVVLNPQTFETQKVIDFKEFLPEPIGNINEVRCWLGQNDRAHARKKPSGVDFRKLRLAAPSDWQKFKEKCLNLLKSFTR